MSMSYSPRLMVALVTLTGIPSALAALYESVLQTNYGPVQGYAAFNSTPYGVNIPNWKDITVWKDIPYGASTAGNNRWKPAQLPLVWNETRDAKDFGPVCPSEASGYTASEDCLSVNIWSAAKSPDDKLPVMLWHHPAGGSGPDPLFDGAGMAAKGVVFVNCNRRDGVLGYLATPELNVEMLEAVGHNASGNWGMLDEFAALNWTYHNIARFGGDPKRITVAGQSAGSAAAYHTVNSGLTKGQIVGGIAESGVRDPRDPEATSLAEGYNNMTFALAQGMEYVAANNVSTIAELRAIALEDLLDATSTSIGAAGSGSSYDWRTTLDGYAMPYKYIDQLKVGPGNDVPFMTGNTRDESGATYGLNLTEAEYKEDFKAKYGNLSTRAMALWTPNNDSESAYGGAYNAMWRDTSLVSSWGYSQGWMSSAQSPIYTYYWDHSPPGQTQGAHHESEINYVLNNLYATDLPWETIDYEIAQKMNAYWANFCKTSSPNEGDSYDGNETFVEYPATSSEYLTMHVGDGWGMVNITKTAAQRQFLLAYFSEQTPL